MQSPQYFDNLISKVIRIYHKSVGITKVSIKQEVCNEMAILRISSGKSTSSIHHKHMDFSYCNVTCVAQYFTLRKSSNQRTPLNI